MKNIVILIVVGVVIYAGYSLLKPDVYVGFFYPNAANLTIDVMSNETFESVSDCRIWVETMALEYVEDVLSHDNGYDYECGKNCDLSGGKPYICEETLR